ncbi:hypothetical protein Tco_1078270, partial [Tanacetum coccineum]
MGDENPIPYSRRDYLNPSTRAIGIPSRLRREQRAYLFDPGHHPINKDEDADNFKTKDVVERDIVIMETIGLLPLATKVKVAVGIARGIVYLCNTENNLIKNPYFWQDSSLWDWDISMGTFELNRYRIFLDEDFTAKLLEYDITKLVEDRDYDKRDLQYHITGLVDGDYYPGFSITLQTMIFSSFRSVFTEVLTGRNFSLEEFHKINNSLHKDGKQSLGLVAKLCYENCNNIDSEQMVLKYFEEYENYIHMGSR